MAACMAVFFMLAGCVGGTISTPTQGGMTIETSSPSQSPEAADSAGRLGETLTDPSGIEVTVTYKGFHDPGPSAYPSSDPAPVFEVAVKNGSDFTVGQDLIKFQASYGTAQVTDADIVCGDTELFSCDTNPAVEPGQSTSVATGYVIPEGSDVRIEVQVYSEDAQDDAEFVVKGTVD